MIGRETRMVVMVLLRGLHFTASLFEKLLKGEQIAGITDKA